MNLSIKISDAQKKALKPHVAPIQSALKNMEVHQNKYAELAAKDRTAEKQVAKYQRAAANFDAASELQLIAALKQRERLREALAKMEELAAADKLPLWRAIDGAASVLQKTLKGGYEQLLDQIASEVGKFHDNVDSLRAEARNYPVVRAFAREFLMEPSQLQSTEGLVAAAQQLHSRIESLLAGTFTWSYRGVAGA